MMLLQKTVFPDSPSAPFEQYYYSTASGQSFAEDDKEMMISGVSYHGMHIPFFDEKKLVAVWKYQMESIFTTIGCLVIARGDAKKQLTKQLALSHEEIAKVSLKTKPWFWGAPHGE
jgi:hypothetical protein